MSKDVERIITERVIVDDLIKGLSFSDEEVVDAAKMQPTLFLHASRLRIQTMRNRVAAEARLQAERAERAGKFRMRGKEAGERVTEGQVQERLARIPEIIKLTKEVTDAEEYEEWSKLLLEAYRMRRDALKVVADMLGAEVYVSRMQSGQSTQMANIRQKLEKKYPKRKREV